LEDDDEIGLTPFVDQPTEEERQAVRQAMAQANVDIPQQEREQPTPQPQPAAPPDSVRQFVSRLKQERTVDSMEQEQVVIVGEASAPPAPTPTPPVEKVDQPDEPIAPQPQAPPRPAPQPRVQQPRPQPTPQPQMQPQPIHHAPAAGDLQLTRFLPRELQAMAMDARPPQHPHVQIVIDRDTRIHLLARHAISARSLNDAMMELMQARQWARQHASLLQMTQPQLRIDAHADPVIHLFTADAKAAALLVGHVDDATKLHLLQQVHVGDASSWFSTELN
jgi:hypothetical protein